MPKRESTEVRTLVLHPDDTDCGVIGMYETGYC